MESVKQKIDRIRRDFETARVALFLTKFQWAQILGILSEISKDPNDIRFESIKALETEIRAALGVKNAKKT